MKFVALENDEPHEVEVVRHGSGYRVRIDERWIEVDLVAAGGPVRSLRMEDGRQVALIHHREGNAHELSFAGAVRKLEIIDPLALIRRRAQDDIGGGGIVKALMPGRVVRVLVNKGDAVRRGTGLLILEAMKMENEITAPADGTVDDVLVAAGQTVEAGAELMHLSAAK